MKFGISLNHKKSIFVVMEGKMLGFIVSKEGMIIDPERIESISKIGLPNSQNSMHSFLGKINFIHRFVPNFSQVIKPLQFLVKKDVPFKWSDEQKNAFTEIWIHKSRHFCYSSPNFGKCILLFNEPPKWYILFN